MRSSKMLIAVAMFCLIGLGLATVYYLTEQKTVAPVENIQKQDPALSNEDKDTEIQQYRQKNFPGVTNAHIANVKSGQPSIDLYYPVFNVPDVDADIADRINARVKDFAQETVIPSNEEMPDNYAFWELSGGFEISRAKERIVSILFDLYIYEGGVHGNREIFCLNYDLETGQRLELADLFANSEKALMLMSQWSRIKLKNLLGDEWSDEDWITSGTEPVSENFTNLVLQPEGLSIVFPPYQVAPWAAGEQKIFLSLSDLYPAEPDKKIWPDSTTVRR